MSIAAPLQRWLLLRGLAREAGHWGAFPGLLREALGTGHAVHTPDLPGNGLHWRERSPASVPALLAALRREGWGAAQGGPLRLVALSLGAMVALEWARCAPQELAGCALVNTSLAGFSPPWQRLRPAAALRLAACLRPGLPAWRREQAVLRLTSANPARHPAVAAAWASLAAQRPVHAANALRQLLAAARYRAPPQAPAVPLLLLRSAGDRLVAPACSAALAARWGAPLLTHPWAGHDLPLDDPAWLAQALAGWAQGAHGGG